MSEKGRCEFVGKSGANRRDGRGRCPVTAAAWDPTNDGMGLIPYCVDCGRDLCEQHLAVHRCGEMRRRGLKRGDAPARYAEDVE